MTTRIRIENDNASNGDLEITAVNVTPNGDRPFLQQFKGQVFPGEHLELLITTSTMISIQEVWPTKKDRPKE